MGQDEDPQPLVRRADFCRREQTRRRRIAHAPKLSQDGFKAEGDMACNVFEEYPFGGTFSDDPGDFWPEVTWIVGTGTLASGAERLTGVSGEDNVEGAVEGPSIETAQIVPDWRGRKIPGALGSDEDAAGPILPFDKCAGVKTGFGEHDAKIQASAACAEG